MAFLSLFLELLPPHPHELHLQTPRSFSITDVTIIEKLPISSEFMENSAKFMKNSGLTKWTQNLR